MISEDQTRPPPLSTLPSLVPDFCPPHAPAPKVRAGSTRCMLAFYGTTMASQKAHRQGFQVNLHWSKLHSGTNLNNKVIWGTELARGTNCQLPLTPKQAKQVRKKGSLKVSWLLGASPEWKHRFTDAVRQSAGVLAITSM